MGLTQNTTSAASAVVPPAAERAAPADGTPGGAAPYAPARGPVAAFARFVLCGGGVSLLSSGVLLLAAGRVPFTAANAVVTVASTLLATELHHRFTFGTGAGNGRAGWRIHGKSALTLVFAYLFTTAAVLVLGVLHPNPSPLLAQAVYLAASALAGIGRFLALRLLVFARRPTPQGAPALHRGKVAVAA
ncbi:hypothetical protein [Streptomyces sp.]|uniref:hypothetical protein n=1 Tax=Streptomyces sp. TaxID=1931 RepID=UPI002F416ABF